MEAVTPERDFDYFSLSAVEQSVASFFEGQVAKYAHQLAIADQDRQLTYDEFNRRANQIAHGILAQPLTGQGQIILFFEQGIDFIVSIFACLKSGHCYVPIDPTFPAERNQYIAAESCARLIVTNTLNEATAQALFGQQLLILNIDTLPLDLPDDNPNIDISPDAPAYLIYTSGSTGKPKGVLQNQRNLLHNARNQINAFHLGVGDRLPILHSCSVMGSVRVIFNTLLNGASLFPFDLKKQGFNALKELLINQKITVFHIVATVFRYSTDAWSDTDFFPDIRLVILGGEAMKQKDIENHARFFPENCLFGTGLGSTETGTVRLLIFNKQFPITTPLVPPGYGVEGVEVKLWDDNDHEVSVGEVGEIVVESQYLALGYWRREAENAQKFSGVGQDSPIRRFRTGDLGRFLPDGCLVHEGRKDFQVKIRGFRVNLAEVENVLMDIDGIKAAVVVTSATTTGAEQLIAFLIGQEGKDIKTEVLRQLLSAKIPDYMIPAKFIVVDSFSQTSNGKLDRLALSHLVPRYTAKSSVGESSNNGLETTLIQIWQSVLKIETLGINDDFFDMGGNSLDAVRICTEVEQTLQQPLTLTNLYLYPTIAKLATFLANRTESPPVNLGRSLIPVQLQGSKPPLFAIHTLGIGCRYFRNLLTQLPADQPLIGVNLQYFSQVPKQFRPIEWFADRYVEDILTYQRQGPYYLIGYSTGGLVTLEVAHRLKELGHEIGLLFLIDTFSPPIFSGQTSLPFSLLYHQIYRPFRDFIKNPVINAKRNYYGLIKEVKFQKYIGKQFLEIPEALAQFAYLKENRQMRNNYVRRSPYFCDLVNIKAAETPDYLHAHWPHWIQGTLKIHEVPGSHTSIVKAPNIQAVAKLLQGYLNQECGME